MRKDRIYKARIEFGDDGRIKVTSYANRLLHFGLLAALNKAVHEVADVWNNIAPWRRRYVRFEHEGQTYMQTDRISDRACVGCCFLHGPAGCCHPHYGLNSDWTKGDCEDKIYKKVKVVWED